MKCYGFVKRIKYWLKLHSLRDRRLNKRCYDMLKGFDDADLVTWASHTNNLLFRFSFDFV